jgi:hypothetical protein
MKDTTATFSKMAISKYEDYIFRMALILHMRIDEIDNLSFDEFWLLHETFIKELKKRNMLLKLGK